jgi:hypothetical protein
MNEDYGVITLRTRLEFKLKEVEAQAEELRRALKFMDEYPDAESFLSQARTMMR